MYNIGAGVHANMTQPCTVLMMIISQYIQVFNLNYVLCSNLITFINLLLLLLLYYIIIIVIIIIIIMLLYNLSPSGLELWCSNRA